MESVGERAVATALRKLLPLIVLMHIIAYVDRLNISFAKDQLSDELALSATAFVWNAESLVTVRLLLGFAEAGFFPGVVYFLSNWFPPEARGRAMAAFLGGIAIAFIVGAPTAGGLLELDGVLGLDGWQWLFLVQGAPAVLVGLYVLRKLPDKPSAAPWLPPEEAQWLERRVVEAREEADLGDMRAAIRDARVR